MSKRKTTTTTSCAGRRYNAQILVDASRAAITAYLELVSRETQKALELLEQLQPWIDGGPVPKVAKRFNELRALTYEASFEVTQSVEGCTAEENKRAEYGFVWCLHEVAIDVCMQQAAHADPCSIADGVRHLRAVGRDDFVYSEVCDHIEDALQVALCRSPEGRKLPWADEAKATVGT